MEEALLFGDSFEDLDSEADRSSSVGLPDGNLQLDFTKTLVYKISPRGCFSTDVDDLNTASRVPFIVHAVNCVEQPVHGATRPVFIDVNFCSSCMTQHGHWHANEHRVDYKRVIRPRYSLSEHDWGRDLASMFPKRLRPLTLIDMAVIAPLYPFRNVVLISDWGFGSENHIMKLKAG